MCHTCTGAPKYQRAPRAVTLNPFEKPTSKNIYITIHNGGKITVM